jgi:uncharacterized membrane protein YidH (DUF202 family)
MGTAVWRKLRIKVMTSPNSFDELEAAIGPDLGKHLALERTRMAGEQTLFSLIRTGFAIAGGGLLITNLLVGEDLIGQLPELISVIFVIIGFILILIGLHRYRQIARKIEEHDGIDPIPSRFVTVIIVLLQLAL